MKTLIFYKAILLGILLQASNFATAVDQPIIAVAANLKFAIQDIGQAFEEDLGKTVRFSFSSSGNLTRQIQQGAPFELFLSANSAYVTLLQQQKLATDEASVIALGRLALISPISSNLPLDENLVGIQSALTEKRLQRFTIANPEHAPYGVAAREALQHQNLWTAIQPVLVLGENVAQSAQFASSGAAQAGLVSYSLALAPALYNKTRSVLIPAEFHKPLEQTAVLLSTTGDTASLFFRYLQSHRAREILVRYGYSIP